MGTLGLWDAVVEAQELCWMVHPGQAHGFCIWPILDYHLDVVQFGPENFGQVVYSFGYQVLEGSSVHSEHIISSEASGCTLSGLRVYLV